MTSHLQSLRFQDSQGHKVAAKLAEPQVKGDSVVILCHGFLSNKDSNTNRRLTELLLANGISTFCFDWFGMGESEGTFADITIGRCCDQLEQALAIVSRHSYNRIGLIGSSYGGLISILVAARYSNLLALGLKCPVPDFPELLRLEFGETAMHRWKETGEIPNVTGGVKPIALRYDFFTDCLKYDAYQAARQITVPTRIVHGEKDELVPGYQIQRLERSLPAKKDLWLLNGANHYFGRPEDFRKMTSLLEDWMVRHLSKESS